LLGCPSWLDYWSVATGVAPARCGQHRHTVANFPPVIAVA